MTVRQLISCLFRHPDDAEVLVNYGALNYRISYVTTGDFKLDGEKEDVVIELGDDV